MAYTESNNILFFSNMLSRYGAWPLDRTSMHSSYEDALKYARKDPENKDERNLMMYSYKGQIITVDGKNENGVEGVWTYQLVDRADGGNGFDLRPLVADAENIDTAEDPDINSIFGGQIETVNANLMQSSGRLNLAWTSLEGALSYTIYINDEKREKVAYAPFGDNLLYITYPTTDIDTENLDGNIYISAVTEYGETIKSAFPALTITADENV